MFCDTSQIPAARSGETMLTILFDKKWGNPFAERTRAKKKYAFFVLSTKWFL